MRVTVRLFAGLREHAGTGRRELELSDRARVGDVWPALELGEEPAGLVFAVNRAYVERDHSLAEGDEVAFIPPVSGGAFRLTEDPIDLSGVLAEVDNVRQFLQTPGLRWMDSHTSRESTGYARVWKDQRTVQRVAVGVRAAGAFALAGLQLIRAVKRALKK